MEHYYQAGDLVVLVGNNYRNVKSGAVGIVMSKYDHLVNVTFPEGSWAFATWQLKPLTKED